MKLDVVTDVWTGVLTRVSIFNLGSKYTFQNKIAAKHRSICHYHDARTANERICM